MVLPAGRQAMFNFRGPKGNTGSIAFADGELVGWDQPFAVEMIGPESNRGAYFWLPMPIPGPETVNNDDATELLMKNPTKTRDATLGLFRPPTVPDGFLAGGTGNVLETFVARGSNPKASHAEGFENRGYEWYAHLEGAGCIVDGKISHAEGNACICTGNDAHAEGNRTVAGRRYYPGSAIGEEDAGDGLGLRNFFTVPAAEGDVTSFFPNPLTDNITTRYGAGAQKDVKGNIYASGYTPAVWTGDVPGPLNDLPWAMHSIVIVRGTAEDELAFVTVVKATWTAGVGTKVYYAGALPFTNLIGIYSSYSPVILGGGNGQHAEGIFTSAWNYGAHAEGQDTRAWNEAAHAEGRLTRALGTYSHSEGYGTAATGNFGSHAEGQETTAAGDRSHSQGWGTRAVGIASSASGYQSDAVRDFQEAYSATGARAIQGDNQKSRIGYTKQCAGVGWLDVKLIRGLENGKVYLFETTVLGRQTAGTAGAVGDSFAYKFQGAVTVAGGALTVLGTISRTLVGRSAGMSGDGLTTGARLTPYTSLYPGLGIGDLILRYDGVADTTFHVTTYTDFQELG